jgi:DNA polymerase-1
MAKDFTYTHYCGYKQVNPNWNKNLECKLVTSFKELKYLLFEKHKDTKFCSFDTETTGLNPLDDNADLVGFSFSYDGKIGYYVPVNHTGYKTLEQDDSNYIEGEYFNLGIEAFDLFYKRMQGHTKTFLANVVFDYNYLEYMGIKYNKNWDMSKCPYYDIFVGLFLADTNVPFPNLKKSEKQYLGWDRDNFEATLGEYTNFAYVPIEMSYQYAGYDALGTYQLAPISLKFFKEAGLSGKLDNEFLYVLTQFTKRGVRCDLELAKKVMQEQEIRVKELEQLIYKEIGYQFNINSGAQLSQALTSIGFDTGQRTKSGAMKTGMDDLKKANEKRDIPHPIVALIVEYKILAKSLSSFSTRVLEEGERFRDNEIRFNYTTFRVPTGRLACSGDSKNKYYAGLNTQALPKPHSKMWYVHDYKEGDEIKEGDSVILDWRFSLVDKSDYMTEALDPHHSIRNMFLPDEGHYWVSMDYSAQELRAIANFSNIPFWKETFLNGGDLHKNTAIAIWGEDKYNHDLRKRAKAANFGLSYGMAYTTAAESFKLSLEDAKDLVDGWWSVCKELKIAQDKEIRKAKKEGTVYNYFGRPRRVKAYFETNDRKQIAFGERTVKNTVIQSVGADLCKRACIKYYKEMCINPKYQGKHRFLSTIHDEINISVSYEDRGLFYEMVKKFYNIMYVRVPGWDVPFDVGIELGNRWGDSFVFKYDEQGNLVPDMFKVEPKKEEPPKVEPKKDEPKKEDSIDLDAFGFDISF